MPGSNTLQRGNEIFEQMLYLPAVVVPNVPASGAATQNITVNGVLVGDCISYNQQGTVSGLSLDNIYVSAINTLTFYWTNTTVSAINSTPPQPFILSVARYENISQGIATMPSSIV